MFMGVVATKVGVPTINTARFHSYASIFVHMLSPECQFYLRFPRPDCDALLAVGMEDCFIVPRDAQLNWKDLTLWLQGRGEWVFGWIGYDARRSIERFEEESLEPSNFPQLALVVPKHVFKIHGKRVEVIKGQWDASFDAWLTLTPSDEPVGLELQPRISFEQYQHHIEELMRQIGAGNVYELNYCVPFEASGTLRNPVDTWKRIYSQTEAPFSAYCAIDGHHVLCASPERYMQRIGNRVISQPIKGTIKRGSSNDEDEQLKEQLAQSRKERAENVMIVDLVRNDLSRCAQRDSVRVDELCGVHTFKTVHHLISTVSCEVEAETSWVDLIKSTFPMGSMTGAPKVSAMRLIAEHEQTERGIYSGSIGYIEPNGNFDFNVVIRSVQYDALHQKISCHVGGAITSLCNADDEYKECLLKAEAILRALRC